MENLIYSVNVTLPVFAILAIGYLLRQAKVIDGAYVSGSNRLTFRLLLPVMLFNNMRSSDFLSYFDVGFLSDDICRGAVADIVAIHPK